MGHVTGVRLRGEFCNYTGYARFARELAFALDDLGMNVQAEETAHFGPEAIGSAAFARLKSMTDPVETPFLVHITTPALARLEPSMTNLLFTQFEASRLPLTWKRLTDLADGIIVPSLSSREAWLAEGVPATKVRQCPQGVNAARLAAAHPLPARMDAEVRGRRFGDHAVRFLNVSDIYSGFRKHPGSLLAAWLAATDSDDDAVLGLKWSSGQGPEKVRAFAGTLLGEIERLVGKPASEAAPILLLCDMVPDRELAATYAGCTHYISVSAGEGWDLPMMEAGAAGLRLIAPDHSGYRAYLNDTIATLLPSRPAHVLTDGLNDTIRAEYAGSMNWEVDLDAAADAIREAIRGDDAYKPRAQETICREFTWQRAAEQLVRILEGIDGASRATRAWPKSDVVTIPDSRVGPISGFRSDRHLTWNILNFGMWEPGETLLAEQVVKPGMHVLDVGANIGYFTLLFAQLAGPGGRVVAVEADPRIFEVLSANIAAQGLSHVEAINAAAGAEPGVAFLDREAFDENPGATYITPEAHGQTVEVPVVALDDLLDPDMPVHYVKCDIQGFEHRALRGLRRTIERWMPIMLVEFQPVSIVDLGDDPAEVLDFYRGLGYDIVVTADYVHPLARAGAIDTVIDEGGRLKPGTSATLLDMIDRSDVIYLNLLLVPTGEAS